MIRRPPRSTRVRSSAASDVYKRQHDGRCEMSFDRAAIAEREYPRDRITDSDKVDEAGSRNQGDVLSFDGRDSQCPNDLCPGGVTAGVHDPSLAVSSFLAEHQIALRSTVECSAVSHE